MGEHTLETADVIGQGIEQITAAILVETTQTEGTKMVRQPNAQSTCHVESAHKTQQIAFSVNDEPINDTDKANRRVDDHFLQRQCVEKERDDRQIEHEIKRHAAKGIDTHEENRENQRPLIVADEKLNIF